MTMMNRNDRFKELQKELSHNISVAIALHKEWCKMSGEMPFMDISNWNDYCASHSVDPTMIDCFRSWDYYVYTANNRIITCEDLGDAMYYGDLDEFIGYYAETLERYNRAMAILKDEKFIVNEVSPDFYI